MADVWLSEAAYIHLRMKTYGVKACPTLNFVSIHILFYIKTTHTAHVSAHHLCFSIYGYLICLQVN